MPAPAIVQNTAITASATSTLAVTLNGVTAGNTIVALLWQVGGASRTYTASDSNGDAWSTVEGNTGGASFRQALVAYCEGSTGGNVTVTFVQSGSHVQYRIQLIEIEASAFGARSTYTELTNQSTHYSAAAGELDAASNAIIIAAGLHNANGGILTESNTLIETSAGLVISQYIRADAGFVDERSTWTSTTARNTIGVSASFIAAAAGTPSGAATINAIATLSGVGTSTRSGTGTIDAIATLAGVGVSVRSGSGTINAVATLAGVGSAPIVGAVSGSGSILAIATLAAIGTSTRSGSGNINAVATLSGNGTNGESNGAAARIYYQFFLAN